MIISKKLKKKFVFDMGKRADIKVGFSCNSNCLFCCVEQKLKKDNNRSTKEIKKILRKAIKNCQQVVFTGGEVTIRKDIIELIVYAKSLGFQSIQIQTNGRLLVYKNFCSEMIEAGVDEFAISLHGYNEKIHDFLTSSPGSFNQTIAGIKNLKELNQKVMTNTVITTKNYKFLPQIAKLLVSLSVDQFQLAFVHIMGGAERNKNWIVPKKNQVMPYVKKAINIGIAAGKVVMTEAIPYCFMQGYENYIAEKVAPETKIFNYYQTIDNFSFVRLQESKTKGPSCQKCKVNNICEGPWREYPEIFGWNEFKPIK